MRPSRIFPLLLLASISAAFQPFDVVHGAAPSESSPLVFFGTYTGGKSQGIYVSRFDRATGRLSSPQLAAETRNPSFLAIHPNRRWLYAVGEIGDFGGQNAGAVSAFEIDGTSGRLSALNAQPSGGSGPCHLAVDRTGKCVLVANYGSGSIAAFGIEADGRLSLQRSMIQHHGLSVNPQRQEGPHAHFITTDPGNRFALTCDLGLDQVLVYHLRAKEAALTPNQPPIVPLKPGSGPRHLAFLPNGRHVYVINELGSSLTLFEYQAGKGRLKEVQTVSTLPSEFHGENTCAEIQVHPSGKFVYASNRGHHSIAAFKIDPRSSQLEFLGCTPSGGKTPRHFTFDPSGEWLLAENQDSDNVAVFRVNLNNGQLTPTGHKIEVGAPVCAVFVH